MDTLNRNLNRARSSKHDEFYTQLVDIEREMQHYEPHFRGRVVGCNCDDPRVSQFFRYFVTHFGRLGLERLIATGYKSQRPDLFREGEPDRAIYLEYAGEEISFDGGVADLSNVAVEYLRDDGDFRTAESIARLKPVDIVVTNPPFSLFREYICQLMALDKKFIVLGSQSAIVYKEIFPFIKEDALWLGVDNGGKKWFEVPDDYQIETKARIKHEGGKKYFSMGSIVWYTNLDTRKRHVPLELTKAYSPAAYPRYDNYDAIEVSRYTEIPVDYPGVMGVPITFLDKYNPDQFEIIGSNRGIGQDPSGIYGRGSFLNGKETFKRLFVRHKHPRVA